MKKDLKILIGIVLILLIGWLLIFIVDYFRVSNFKLPIFVVCDDTLKNHNSFVNNEIVSNKDDFTEYPKFRALVIEFNGDTMIVEPIEQEDKNIVSNKVIINLGENNDIAYFKGEEVLITYTGMVKETYPSQIDLIDIDVELGYTTKIEDLPQEYLLEDAINDNCVINMYDKIYNKDELDRFLKNVENNVPDFIRVLNFTIEGDMIITDVRFEGGNSFRACHDSTRDKFSGEKDRTYKYCRYSDLETEEDDDTKMYYLEDLIEGDIEEMYIIGFENDVEIVN